MPLNARQERFCNEYLIDLNGTQAAIRAGYSSKTADRIASENLRKLDIVEFIGKRKEELASKLEITQEMILEGYRKLAFYDSRKFYNEKGDLLHIPDLDEETAFALAGFEVADENTKKIKMSDRKGALDSLCKVLGYNAPDKVANTDSKGNDIIPPPVLTDKQFNKLINTINEASAR